jgi:tetratricopeptide (TPR) repeat protein/transcriptional regulator with XRE-family HTH domain
MEAHPLKIEREKRGWSQNKVAESIGATARAVSRWEQGHHLPSSHYREQLCLLFGKTAWELGLQQLSGPLNEAEETGESDKADGSGEGISSLDLPRATSEEKVEPETILIDPTIPLMSGRVGELLGRSALLQDAIERLTHDGKVALTALQGLPGVGKTALAVAVARDPGIQERFPDGILWAGLGLQPNVAGQLARWGMLLGIRPTEVEDANSQEAWGRALHGTIGQRRMLLIIDDAWSVEDALALQIGGSHCAHLLTTRLPRVAAAFADEGVIAVSELAEADGLALLARSVPQLIQQDTAGALALVKAVNGLPLALTLMERYLASHALSGQPRRLQAALIRLRDAEQRLRVSVPVAVPERMRDLSEGTPLSLQATIALSDQLLDERAHQVLCAFSLFPPKPNSFSEEAALAVSQQTLAVLDALWDTGLLESSGVGRYTLHQTIADYARLVGKPEIPVMQRRFVLYMSTYLQKNNRNYFVLDVELDNIQAALDAAADLRMHQELIAEIDLLVPFMRTRGYYLQADCYLQMARTSAIVLGDPLREGIILRHLASLAEVRGDYPQAERYSQQGLLLARRHGQHDAECGFLTTLGLVAFRRGDPTQAIVYYEQGLSLARQIEDSLSICNLLLNLGISVINNADYRQAEELLQEGLALAHQCEYQELICHFLLALGKIQGEQGRYVQAETYLFEGLALARQLGYRELLGRLLNSIGVLTKFRGNYEQAAIYFHEGLALARRIGNRVQTCMLLTNLGDSTLASTDYPQAERYLQEGVDLAREAGFQSGMPLLLSNLGEAIGWQGDYKRANLSFQESLELARQIQSPWHICATLGSWGDIHLNFQQVEEALAAFQEVLAMRETHELDPLMVAWAQYGLGRVAALREDLTEARALGLESLATFEALGHYKAKEVQQWMAALPVE